jgi:tetratricopeptide (TPR) repeat protein
VGRMRVTRFFEAAFWTLAVVVVVAHALGTSHPAALWGANLYRFLPRAALAIGCLLLIAVMMLAIARPALLERPLGRGSIPAWARRLGMPLGMIAFFAACWRFREGHTLLGDGNPLVHDLPAGQRFHPHEPVTYLIHHVFYRFAGGLFHGMADPTEVARATVGLSSAVAGALFVPVAWGIAQELTRFFRGAAGETTEDTGTITPLVFLVLLAQGYIQLFFGYVENYTFNTLIQGVYLWTALRHLRGVAPLALPGMALALNVSLDLSAVMLAPSFLVLVVRAVMTPGARARAARDLAIVALVAFALTRLMAWVEPGYDMAAAAVGVVTQALFARGAHTDAFAYMFSLTHVRDFFNEQMLIGPVAAFLLVTGLVGALLARTRVTAVAVFVGLAGLASLAGAWVTTDLALGYPRDWDLFAPSALAFTVAGLWFTLAAPWHAVPLRRNLLLLGCVGLFHTVPWIALNTSFDRSFARFQTLPLGLGRMQAVVGSTYLARGDTTQAISWFQRSLDEYPWNNVAAYSLGRIAANQDHYEFAARAFWVAVRARPDKDLYRLALVDAIVRGGGPPAMARAQLDTLLMRAPNEPVYWAASGVVCLGSSERDRAATAFERARELAPDDSTYRGLGAYLAAPDGYARAVRERWPAIVGR